MTEWISLSGTAVALFVSTNIDNLFALLAFFSDRKYQGSHVVLGQYIGFTTIFAVSVAAASASKVIPIGDVGWLGVIPMAIGFKKMWDWRRESASAAGFLPEIPRLRRSGAVMTVALICVANGGDNIGAYAPQFAVHSRAEIALMGLVFALMNGIWCLAAQGMVKHPALRTPLRVYGHRIVPFMLIGLGLMTLYEGGIGRSMFR
jgi:cadmium resistance protein CadD (predicted permease)